MASERNNGILIGGKRPEYVHSAQGTGLRRILGLPALVFFGLVYMVPLTMFTTYGVVTEITGGRTASATWSPWRRCSSPPFPTASW